MDGWVNTWMHNHHLLFLLEARHEALPVTPAAVSGLSFFSPTRKLAAKCGFQKRSISFYLNRN